MCSVLCQFFLRERTRHGYLPHTSINIQICNMAHIPYSNLGNWYKYVISRYHTGCDFEQTACNFMIKCFCFQGIHIILVL